MNRPVYLIGGAPTTGKSNIAAALARKIGLPWISTDQIREVMRVATSRENHPMLFNPDGYDGERFLTEFSPDQIVDMEFAQAEAVWVGISKLIRDDYTWTNGFIVEGVNIVPHLVARDFAGDAEVKAAFLVDEDADRMREVIFKRGLWDDADKYPDAVKEKEVEWATLFSHRLKAEAATHGFEVVEVSKSDSDLDSLLRAFK